MRGMQMGMGLGAQGNSGVTYGADATALFARRATQPDAATKAAMNTLFLALRTGAISGSDIVAKGVILSLYADSDADDALLNWLSASYPATRQGGMLTTAPDFTADRGYKGDALAKYLDTGFSDDTAAVNWTRNSASYGVWINQDPVNSGIVLGNAGTGVNTTLTPRSTGSGLMSVRLHGGVSLTAAVANRLGFSFASRTTSTNTESYRNGASLGNSATASTAPAVSNLTVFKNNVTFASDRVAALWVGGALDDNEQLDLYNALLAYLTFKGAN